MAISTYKVFLMKGTPGTGDTMTWAKLLDIKDFPDVFGDPEMLDTTTLSDSSRTSIPGIQGDNSGLPFTANYTKSDFDTIYALKDTETDYAVWFGGTESNGVVTPTGSDGKYKFKGYAIPKINGGGVNEVVNMTINIAPTTSISVDE